MPYEKVTRDYLITLLHQLHASHPTLALCFCNTQLESEYTRGKLTPGLYKEAAAPKTYVNNMVRSPQVHVYVL